METSLGSFASQSQHSMHPRAMHPKVELSVVVPCLNEELNIPELSARILRTFARGGFMGELVLVDDGSTDGSVALMRALEARTGEQRDEPSTDEGGGFVRCATHAQNRGIAAAWRTGVHASTGRLVAVIDADLQYQPEDLLRLRRELHDASVDVVQGWRSPVGRLRDRRYTISRGFNHLLNGVFGMSLRDNKSGFVMCSREVFEDLLTYRGSYFYWQSFIMVAAHAKGYSYKQVESLFEQRKQGESFLDKTALSASMKSIYDLGRAAWEYRVAQRQPDPAAQVLARHPMPAPTRSSGPSAPAQWRAYLGAFNRTHHIITRGVEHHVRTLSKTQWLPDAALRELADEKLRRLLRHCYRNVPFYRQRMERAGVHPDDVRGAADLMHLPITERDDVREHRYFDIMSENHDKSNVLKLTSCGRFDEPATCYADRHQLEFRWAATARAREATGYRFGDPWVQLIHPELSESSAERARRNADNALRHRRTLSVSELGKSEQRALLEELRASSPVLLEAEVEALLALCPHLEASPLASPAARAIMASGQTLTSADRDRIEEAFGCPVLGRYSSAEFSTIAHECSVRDGYHLVTEGYIVEIWHGDRPARPGEWGDILITDLNNYCMPFVRYRIGDRAMARAPERCDCGRAAPRIGPIDGREALVLSGADDSVLLGGFVSHYLKEHGYAIERFGLEQRGAHAIGISITKGARFGHAVVDQLRAALVARVGAGTDLTIELEESADPLLSMKPTGARSPSAITEPGGADTSARSVPR